MSMNTIGEALKSIWHKGFSDEKCTFNEIIGHDEVKLITK
jgi:hypothetical protein